MGAKITKHTHTPLNLAYKRVNIHIHRSTHTYIQIARRGPSISTHTYTQLNTQAQALKKAIKSEEKET